LTGTTYVISVTQSPSKGEQKDNPTRSSTARYLLLAIK